MLGPDDLVLHAGTLRHASVREFAAAARAGGFAGVSLYPGHFAEAATEGLDPADVGRLLADAGLVYADLDVLLGWLPGERPTPGMSATEDEFYALADALGARSLNVAHFGGPVDPDLAAEALAGVCDRAAEHGLLITLEYLPFSGIADAATAWEVVRRTERPNATLMFDAWHTFRGPTDEAQLRAIPGERFGSIQLNDAPTQAQEDLVAETMSARRLPGEGDAPLVDWIRLLDAQGCSAPVGVEVFSAELDALPPEEAGRRCGEAARRVLATARG